MRRPTDQGAGRSIDRSPIARDRDEKKDRFFGRARDDAKVIFHHAGVRRGPLSRMQREDELGGGGGEAKRERGARQ